MKRKLNIFVPALSGFQYGYNTSILVAALLFITSSFSLTPLQQGLLVGTTMMGTCLASFSAILSNRIGRKPVLFLGVLFFLVGSGFCLSAPNYSWLLAGRLLIGLGAGIGVVVAPLYLVEVAPVESRGKILHFNQIGIAIGSCLAYVCGYLFAQDWRSMFAIALIPAALQALGLFFIDESLKEKIPAASWKGLWEPSYRSRLYLALQLVAFQAFCGSSAIAYFSPRVFEKVGLGEGRDALLPTLGMGLIFLMGILVSSWVVDRLGRRFLLCTSFIGMGLSLLIIAFFSWIQSPWLDAVTVVAVLSNTAFFALGVGPVPPLITGEMSPTQVRGHIMTLTGIFGWICNYCAAVSFLPLMSIWGIERVFPIYAGFCLAALLIFHKIPETKKKSLEEIEYEFTKIRS